MGSPKYTIRRPLESDRQQWESLWQSYVVFYQSTLADDITTVLWQRIHDYQHPIMCFVAEQAGTGEVIGFVHYFPHPGTWHNKFVCYLEDLFVSPEIRGGGIGEALIKAVTDEAKKAKLGRGLLAHQGAQQCCQGTLRQDYRRNRRFYCLPSGI